MLAIDLGQPDGKTSWSKLKEEAEEMGLEQIKNIVNPLDYKKAELPSGKSFYMNKSMTATKKEEYGEILEEYLDIFAWIPSDLSGISSKLEEHWIDLMEGAVPIWHRQYQLNFRYSLLVKEEIDALLEAGFIYLVNNFEWVSPIVEGKHAGY